MPSLVPRSQFITCWVRVFSKLCINKRDEIELSAGDIPYESQQKLDITYKGQRLTQQYKPDFVVYERIIVELKALNHQTSHDQAQLLNYLLA